MVLPAGEITHVCIAPSIFPLMQYLLLVDLEVSRDHTYYFFNDVIPAFTRQRLVCSCLPNRRDKSIKSAVMRRAEKLAVALFKTLRYPFIKTAKIFAFDNPNTSLYIGNRPYSLLSDGPHCFSRCMQEQSVEYIQMCRKSKSFFGKLQRLIYGDVFVDYFGSNRWCEKIYLTEENASPILKNKTVDIRSLEQMWAQASDEKRNFILSLFGISIADIDFLNSKPTVFFSQPIIEDIHLSTDEYADIIKRLFSHYDTSRLLIKTHPRDHFPYREYFPEVEVFDKSVNSQLLQVAGFLPKKIVTIYSSSVDTFPESVECDYFGVEVHPDIVATLGPEFKPYRKVNKVAL